MDLKQVDPKEVFARLKGNFLIPVVRLDTEIHECGQRLSRGARCCARRAAAGDEPCDSWVLGWLPTRAWLR